MSALFVFVAHLRVKFFTVLDESFPCFLEAKERDLLFTKERGVEFAFGVKKIVEGAPDSTRRNRRETLFRLSVLILRRAFNPLCEKNPRLPRLKDKIAKVVERDFPFFRERIIYPAAPWDVPRLRTRSRRAEFCFVHLFASRCSRYSSHRAANFL